MTAATDAPAGLPEDRLYDLESIVPSREMADSPVQI